MIAQTTTRLRQAGLLAAFALTLAAIGFVVSGVSLQGQTILDAILGNKWMLASSLLGAVISLYLPGVPALVGQHGVTSASSRETARLFINNVGVLPAGIGAALLATSSVLALTPRTAFMDLPPFYRSIPGNDRLLVFLHGWNGDPVETWNQFPSLVGSDPRFAGVDILSISYPTYIWKRNLRIPQLARWIKKELDTSGMDRYQQAIIVAHSMGGLVARHIVIKQILASQCSSFGLLVEVATPHGGAEYSYLASLLGISKEFTRDLAPNSDFLVDLSNDWKDTGNKPQSSCYASKGDEVVPEESATRDCDKTLTHLEWGHTELVKPEAATDPRYAFPMQDVVIHLQATPRPCTPAKGSMPPSQPPVSQQGGAGIGR